MEIKRDNRKIRKVTRRKEESRKKNNDRKCTRRACLPPPHPSRPALLPSLALVPSHPAPPVVMLLGKKDIRKRRRLIRRKEESRNNKNLKEDVPVGSACSPVPSHIALADGLGSVPSRPTPLRLLQDHGFDVSTVPTVRR